MANKILSTARKVDVLTKCSGNLFNMKIGMTGMASNDNTPGSDFEVG
jgi:hypothetical protein